MQAAWLYNAMHLYKGLIGMGEGMLKSMHAHTIRPSVLDTVKLYNTFWLYIMYIPCAVLHEQMFGLEHYYIHALCMHATFKEHYM